ncbi:MAG: magnesium transporter [Anaerolineae bacterium]|nr:magnesium transporter [Anaerolineae bacterium]
MVEELKKPKVTNPDEIDVIEEAVLAAVEQDNFAEAAEALQQLHAPDQADVFEDLEPEDQDQILELLTPEVQADILEELEDEDTAEVASRQEPEDLARIIELMEPDKAADLLGDIDLAQAIEVLEEIQEPQEVRPLLAYPDDSAGGIMTSLPISLVESMTVDQAIQHIRAEFEPDDEDIYYLFVTNTEHQLVGVVSVRQLLLGKPQVLISQIMNKDVISIEATADQEEAARLMSRYDLLALPVIDDGQHLLGLITFDDSVEVLEDEATEDIYRLGGVPQGNPSDISVKSAVKNRLPWLSLNMLTAMGSATVLSLFESTLAQYAVLTAFLPIVAGMGGNAATQTLTVTVRGLALGEIESSEGWKTLARELTIGLIDGAALGVIVSLIAMVWKGSPLMGLVVGISVFLNLICAALAGVLVPVIMSKLRFDPALASPILFTPTTDAFGYLIYLTVATLFFIPFIT